LRQVESICNKQKYYISTQYENIFLVNRIYLRIYQLYDKKLFVRTAKNTISVFVQILKKKYFFKKFFILTETNLYLYIIIFKLFSPIERK